MGLLDAHLITEITDVVTAELGTVPHPQLLGPLAPPLPLRTQLGVKQFSLTEGRTAEDEEATKVTTALFPLPLQWLPDRAGLISGIILMGYGIGSFIWTSITTWYINPANLQPDVKIGQDL